MARLLVVALQRARGSPRTVRARPFGLAAESRLVEGSSSHPEHEGVVVRWDDWPATDKVVLVVVRLDFRVSSWLASWLAMEGRPAHRAKQACEVSQSGSLSRYARDRRSTGLEVTVGPRVLSRTAREGT